MGFIKLLSELVILRFNPFPLSNISRQLKQSSNRASRGVFMTLSNICDALRDLVAFVQFKKREKHPWRSVTFRKPATLLKVTLLHGCFSRSLNCTNSTKSRNAPHL